MAVSAAAETAARSPQIMSEGGRSQTNTVLGTFVHYMYIYILQHTHTHTLISPH